MKNKLLIPLILALATPVIAQTIPVHQGWLADEANLLSPSEEDQLRNRSHIGDYQVCILTMPSTMGSEPKDVAVNTLNTWNPGPNSVIILVSLNPRKLYLQPGTSLKNIFTEEVALRICREVIKPHLSQGRNFQGLHAGVDAIRLTIYPVEASASSSGSSGLSIFLWLLGGGGLLLVVALILFKFLPRVGIYPFSSAPEPYRCDYKDDYTKHSADPTPHFPTPSMSAKAELPRVVMPAPTASKKVTKKAKPASTPYESSSSYEAPSSSYDSSSYEPYKYDSSPSSFDSGSSSFSCDSGGGGGSDF